jgi:hypothetical protein
MGVISSTGRSRSPLEFVCLVDAELVDRAVADSTCPNDGVHR